MCVPLSIIPLSNKIMRLSVHLIRRSHSPAWDTVLYDALHMANSENRLA